MKRYGMVIGLNPEKMKGPGRTGNVDLFKNSGTGEVRIFPKSGAGPGEPTNFNIR